MSLIKLQGNPGGTGTLTLASPNTNSDFTLNLPASNGTVLLDGASQSPTFGTVTATTATVSGTTTSGALVVNSNNISAVNSLGFRNRIINGDMRIDQRNAGAAVALAGGNFPVDRMRLSTSGVIATATVQQNLNSITPPAGFQNYIGMSVTSGSATGSSAAGRITQRIEGFNVSDLGFGAAGASTVTLSFWVRASSTGTFGGSLQNSDGNRIYVFSYTINSVNTWEYKTVTITGDTSGTWPKTNGIGMLLLFSVGSGSTFQSAAGSWGSTYYDTVTGQVDLLATTGATFYITGVQLEAGSVATPFERRDYGRELIMCQRYYQRYDSGGNVSFPLLMTWAFSATGLLASPRFSPQMRAAPSFTTSGMEIWTPAGSTTTLTSVVMSAATTLSARLDVVVPSSIYSAGQVTFLQSNATNGNGVMQFSAEL